MRFDADGAPPTMTRKVKLADPVPALRLLAQINQLISPDSHQLNIFVNLDSRLDAANQRRAAAEAQIEKDKIVSEQ